MGEVAARVFAREGAKVALHYSGLTSKSASKAESIVGQLEKSGFEAMRVKADVAKYSEVKLAVDSVVARWGRVDAIVDFAGLPSSYEFWQEDPLDLSDEDLLSAIGVDFLGSYHFIRAARDFMKKERYGKIVLISSSPTVYGDDAGYRYILAKDLIRITVKSLAARLVKDYGITLNAIAPGTVDTPNNRVNYGDGWDELVGAIPIGRAGRAEDIVGVALFLCSHLSDFVVGQTIVADGGEIRL
jgi:3-oxoacyl-[acyl-carrier protein] reductase